MDLVAKAQLGLTLKIAFVCVLAMFRFFTIFMHANRIPANPPATSIIRLNELEITTGSRVAHEQPSP